VQKNNFMRFIGMLFSVVQKNEVVLKSRAELAGKVRGRWNTYTSVGKYRKVGLLLYQTTKYMKTEEGPHPANSEAQAPLLQIQNTTSALIEPNVE
jgi:hypothetical protein